MAFVLVYIATVHAFRKVLSQQAVGILVGTTLPWMLWIAEVHIDVGRQAEALMVSQLLATIPSQRLIEFPR